MDRKDIELGSLTADQGTGGEDDGVRVNETADGSDTAGLVLHPEMSEKERAEIARQKEAAIMPYRENVIHNIKKAMLVLLFVCMLGSTALYVYGPGNEQFDHFPLFGVSETEEHYYQALSWPRYLFEVEMNVAPSKHPNTWIEVVPEGQPYCDPASPWVEIGEPERKNVSTHEQIHLSFELYGTLNETVLPLNACIRLTTRTNSPDWIAITFKASQFGVIVKYEVLFSALILIAVYILISFEIVHRTVAGAIGAFTALGVLSLIRTKLTLREVVTWIDQDTIGLLFGMMLMVEIFSKTGFFEFAAVKAFKLSRGNVRVLVIALCVLTCLLSAVLDNVTTMLLIGPVSLQLANVIQVDPVPILLSEVFFSNLGGTATLIGDPPNIIIAEALELTFNDFIKYLAPAVLLAIVPCCVFVALYFRKEINKTVTLNVADLEAQYGIKDKFLCAIILGAVVLLFFLEPVMHMEQAWVALLGATIMTLVARPHDIEHVLHKIEWATLLFFMTLFVMLEGLSELGLVEFIGETIGHLIERVPEGGRLIAALNIMVWVSAVLSAFIDNIPYTVTMVAVIETLSAKTGLPLRPLAWALSLGTCLGGNGTLIGASANVVTAGIAQAHGHPISFIYFLKTGMPFMFLTVVVASLYSTLAFGVAGLG